MKQTIACIGQGFVGGSLTTVMSENGLNIAVYDKSGKKVVGAYEWSHPSLEPTNIASLINLCECVPEMHFMGVYFVALPTPMMKSGECDLSIIDGVLSELASYPGERIAVIKSTVPPGSTNKWNEKFNGLGLYVVHNPEFLREATALDDMRNQNRIILGGPRPWINKVRDIYREAFPTVPIFKTSSTNSEMIKYVINTFLATKVSFANEIYQICEKISEQGEDIDYDKIIELVSLDERIGNSHFKVPGPMPADDGTGQLLRGFAGSCILGDSKITCYECPGCGCKTCVKETANCNLHKDYSFHTISEIYDDFVQYNKTPSVLSFDEQLQLFELKEIEEVTRRFYEGYIHEFEYRDDNNQINSITCTPEHVVPVKRNDELILVQTQDINLCDKLYVVSNGKVCVKELYSITKSYFEGFVYNLELNSERPIEEDDLFFVANDIVIHNCFVKDLNSLIHKAKQLGVDPKVMKGTWEKNLEVRPGKDWERLVGRAVSKRD